MRGSKRKRRTSESAHSKQNAHEGLHLVPRQRVSDERQSFAVHQFQKRYRLKSRQRAVLWFPLEELVALVWPPVPLAVLGLAENRALIRAVQRPGRVMNPFSYSHITFTCPITPNNCYMRLKIWISTAPKKTSPRTQFGCQPEKCRVHVEYTSGTKGSWRPTLHNNCLEAIMTLADPTFLLAFLQKATADPDRKELTRDWVYKKL